MGLTSQSPASGHHEAMADLLKSLANPQRLMIVCALVHGERAVSVLERDLAIRQPSLSQHLASLREAEIIAARRQAKTVYYKVIDPRVPTIIDTLLAVFGVPPGKRRAGTAADARTTAPPLPRATEAAFFAVVEAQA